MRPSTSTSLGHFRVAATPAWARNAAATAIPVSSGSQARAAGATVTGRSSTENTSAARGGLDQDRPRRPRPAVCVSAASTRPSAAPAWAAASRSALVEPVSLATWMSRHRPPGRTSLPPSGGVERRPLCAA